MSEPIRRALISVSDKTGLIAFASRLSAMGVELVSTGGTSKALAAAGLPVTDVVGGDRFSGDHGWQGEDPASQDSRRLAGRARQCDASGGAGSSRQSLLSNCWWSISILSRQQWRASASWDETIENIDVGGPAMIRAAAKNHDDLTVVVDPADYEAVLAEMVAHNRADDRCHAAPLCGQGIFPDREL